MNEFIAKFGDQVMGVLSSFDRLVLRGTLRAIAYKQGMEGYLSGSSVLLKNFARHVHEVSTQLKRASLAAAQKLGREIRYLTSPQQDKEEVARSIAAEYKITEGLICVLTCVEPCQSFEVRRNPESKQLELEPRLRKCLFLYHYSVHPRFGFMNARIQTWFPFAIQICLNGREWLARQMDRQSLRYVRRDNCFPWIEDFPRAQRLMDAQQRINWPKGLDAIARQLNPIHEEVFRHVPVHYYWTVRQSEWASDVAFRDAAVLQRLYPLLIHHAVTHFGSPQVLRFLGHRTPQDGHVPGWFHGEATTDLRERQEGVRIKHTVNENSLKLYDKAYTARGSILRPEVTLNNPADLRVYRPKEGDPKGPKAWRPFRRGIADVHRRGQVSQQAITVICKPWPRWMTRPGWRNCSGPLEHPVTWKKKRVRALRPLQAPDAALLDAVGRGEFLLHGFRNRDLQGLLFSQGPGSPKEKRRRSAWVGRQIRLLRAHGLIRKVPRENCYHVTPSGRRLITAVLAARKATVAELSKAA